MSRGPGRCQRRILTLVSGSPEGRLDRTRLEAVLVGEEGFFSTNVRRAIRTLVRDGYVVFTDRRRKEDSVIALPPEPKPLSDEEVFALIDETTNAKPKASDAEEERHAEKIRTASASHHRTAL